MEEVDTSECTYNQSALVVPAVLQISMGILGGRTCNDWEDGLTSARKIHLGSTTNVWEGATFSKFDEGQLGVIRMSGVIFKTMTSCSKQT